MYYIDNPFIQYLVFWKAMFKYNLKFCSTVNGTLKL